MVVSTTMREEGLDAHKAKATKSSCKLSTLMLTEAIAFQGICIHY